MGKDRVNVVANKNFIARFRMRIYEIPITILRPRLEIEIICMFYGAFIIAW